jgi:hypothetical protein
VLQSLMFDFIALRRIFLFWIPVHPTRPRWCHVFASLQHGIISPLRLHVDRGLERHGYPRVPTDQGPGGPCQVDLTCQKPRRPASGLGDHIHNPGDLGRPQATSSRLQKTCRACGASFSPRSRCGAASRSEDRRILSIITEDDLPNP